MLQSPNEKIMGNRQFNGIIRSTLKTTLVMRRVLSLSVAFLLAALPSPVQAKSYSSGSRSYSSSSSRSSSSRSSFGSGSHNYSSGSSRSSGSGSSRSSSSSGGSSYRSSSSSGSSGSKGFSSGSGRSYSSGSGSSGSDRKGYSSSKSYSAGSGTKYSSGSSGNGFSSTSSSRPASKSSSDSSSSGSGFSYDSSAARARKEETSKSDFSRFKESQSPPRIPSGGSYSAPPPPIPTSSRTYRRDTVYIPTTTVIQTRPSRINIYFGSYGYRPWVYYNDPYSSLFWWWLLDRSLDEQAYWAYHHRYDMDPARYQTLLASNAQLQQRVSDLEAQQLARDTSYTPPSLDQTNRDLMYSDDYVARNYSTRPTTSGTVAFWVFAVPLGIGGCAFFIWLIWFKRW